ncbi:glucosyltransferase [Candida orthopsilosis Co 90-125]|uniref:Glucosyltransferase n=1 Tax=Candida orthopsilosis (strain 90-125) TaxID=1136231 RepID=H8WX26_CANO9|nr:glucosyltransferase [Candida orthopsilosis Co 90-125]CCG21166.1 glucosyltransferase [Candida orthopsilosis Co 90-125]
MGILSKRKKHLDSDNDNHVPNSPTSNKSNSDLNKTGSRKRHRFSDLFSHRSPRGSLDSASINSGPSILRMSSKTRTAHRLSSPTRPYNDSFASPSIPRPTSPSLPPPPRQQQQPHHQSRPQGPPQIIAPLDEEDNSLRDYGEYVQDASQDPAIAVNVTRQDSRTGTLGSSKGSHLQAPPHSDTQNSAQSSLNNISPTKSSTNDSHTKNESGGFISSLLAAASNKMSTLQDPDEKEKKKDHSFANRLDNFIKSVKHEEENLLSPGHHSDSTSMVASNSGIQRVSTDGEHDAAQSVQFEPVRESPLNTMGNGDLSLADFENSQIQAVKSITSQRSIDGPGGVKRAMSPSQLNRNLPPGNQLQATSNGMDVKRVHRMSTNGGSVPATERSVSNGRASVAQSTVTSPSGTVNESQAPNRTLDQDRLAYESGSENEELDNVIDYNTKIEHAPKKRNKEFHHAFKKLPKSERLIDDFSCALSKDILVQGKMYLSDHYVCFNSNILGWIKHIIIPLQEVIQIEKKSTAGLFPNGMIIKTLHQRYTFASIIGRVSAFKLITNVWHRLLLEKSNIDPKQIGKKAQSSTANGASGVQSDSDDGNTSDDENSGGSDDDDETSLDEEGEEGVTKGNGDTPKSEEGSSGNGGNGGGGGDSSGDSNSGFNGFPIVGPATHAPTETGYSKSSDETFITEDIIKAPPGVVYLLLFGSDTSKFVRVLKDQKNFDVDESGLHGLTKDNKSRHYTYIKPLGGPIGPKQTKCLLDDDLIEYNPEKFYEIVQTTQTPDVPSGNSFKVKTKIFLSWAQNNQTKIWVVSSIEWSGKSWIKGAIEKGTIDGQKDSMKDMIETLNTILAEGNNKKDGGATKRKSTRSRRNTEKKEKPEEKPVELPKTIPEQISALAKSIGDSVPISIIDSTIMGFIIMFFTFLVVYMITNKFLSLFSHGGSKDISRSKVYCDAEREVWQWIISRSENKLDMMDSLNCSHN